MIFLLLCIQATLFQISSASKLEKRETICTEPGEEYQECGHPCEPTCASFYSKPECYETCRSGCFCKKGYVRHFNEGETSAYPKCIKASECPKKECPDFTCAHWEEKHHESITGNRWLQGCIEEKYYPDYGMFCSGSYSPKVSRETILYQLTDLDDDDASAIRSVMDKIEQSTCVKWRQLPRCCLPNEPKKLTNNFLNISDSSWCLLNVEQHAETCIQIPSPIPPSQWSEDRILHTLLFPLGIESETTREEKNLDITINLNILINGRKLYYERHKNPLDSKDKSYENSLISITIGGKPLVKKINGKSMNTISYVQKINDLFKCPPKKAIM